MSAADLQALAPLLVLGGSAVLLLLAIPFRRRHALAAGGAALALVLAGAALPLAAAVAPRRVTALLTVDRYALLYIALILAAGLVTVLLAAGYQERRGGERPEELYPILLLATLGAAVLAAASHFATFFLGLETLSVSLYALIAYPRERRQALEAGTKYLILAGASSAFLLFGMALVYFEAGSMELAATARALAAPGLVAGAGLALILVGVGFKLAVVPFHLWTPDVYQGAPAPVTGFVATASKGGVFALLLRYAATGGSLSSGLFAALAVIAIASMLAGNLLALLQGNVKRILAYSSIAHLGYLLVALLAAGEMAAVAVTFYLTAYFVTTLGAFGILAALSDAAGEPEELEDLQGLFWRRPTVAALLTAALLSLAGIPLTAGFLGKFYLLAAGVGAALWTLVIVLVATSVVGLFYYLRIVVAMIAAPPPEPGPPFRPLPAPAALTLAVLAGLLLWWGVYPAPLLRLIEASVASLF